MIAYHDVEKDRPGEGLPSRREAEDARLQGGGSGRNRHEHDRRRIPADDVHGQGGREDALSLRPAAAPAGSGPAQRELARSEGDSQEDERRLPGGSDRAHERFVEGFRILDRDRPGRDPRENPEGREAFEEVGRAVEVVQFGRGRWNIENNFKVEKHDGFGPGRNFCNKARASRNFYLLMQIANNLWQVFNLGHLARLQKRRRKVPQKEWVEIIREAFHAIGIDTFDEVPRRYLSREPMT